MTKGNASNWQTDPINIKTDKVQLWSDSGIMLTAQITNKEAQGMVADGRCFIITDQAISFYETQLGKGVNYDRNVIRGWRMSQV